MVEIAGYKNVAIGKPATQSSLSQWSSKLGAGAAVTGVIPDSLAIHTNHEVNPWWMVDLEYVYPIERIVIHNRLDGLPERAKTCMVEISKDGEFWTVVHAGIAHFLGGKKGNPLTLPLGRKELARYVRVSLQAKEYLHLAQVEVFADPAAKIRDRYKLKTITFGGAYAIRAVPKHMQYLIEGGDAEAGGDVELIGLRLTPIGRLGNQMLQLINATAIAWRLGLRYVQVLNGGLINCLESVERGGIIFLPTGAPQPEPGAFLTGNFFFHNDLHTVLDDVTRKEGYNIIQDIVAPLFMKPLPLAEDIKYPDELTIHFRAGDIFSDPAAAQGYTQPPVAFYILIVRHCIAQGLITRVRLVFENHGNPCIAKVISFLEEEKIPYRTQSGTLPEDIASLVDARYLVFGFGSFGLACALLSKDVDTVFCFQGFSDSGYRGMPSVKNLVLIRDRDKKYTKVGEWRATKPQLQLMLDYPETALEVVVPKVK